MDHPCLTGNEPDDYKQCEHHPRFILYYQDEGPPFCAACEIERLKNEVDDLQQRLCTQNSRHASAGIRR